MSTGILSSPIRVQDVLDRISSVNARQVCVATYQAFQVAQKLLVPVNVHPASSGRILRGYSIIDLFATLRGVMVVGKLEIIRKWG